MWCTVQTNTIRSKSAAADWVIKKLTIQHQSAMKRAKNIYIGNNSEHWEDIKDSIEPCANFVFEQINNQLHILKYSPTFNISITIAD